MAYFLPRCRGVCLRTGVYPARQIHPVYSLRHSPPKLARLRRCRPLAPLQAVCGPVLGAGHHQDSFSRRGCGAWRSLERWYGSRGGRQGRVDVPQAQGTAQSGEAAGRPPPPPPPPSTLFPSLFGACLCLCAPLPPSFPSQQPILPLTPRTIHSPVLSIRLRRMPCPVGAAAPCHSCGSACTCRPPPTASPQRLIRSHAG